ncbi:MAG: SAM-dependent methyltransferase [Chitinophagaceae bacterium]|nr:MAG: SAM-dependent methyltransferase [Chitinophagaceae bacterium]
MSQLPKASLKLFPCTIGGEINYSIPEGVKMEILECRNFIVENERTARRFLKALDRNFPLEETQMSLLNKHSREQEIPLMLKALEQGNDVGILSESGCPAVGDPGALVVAMAHKKGYQVKPFTGPSSFLLALMASGLNGQQFAFHGYLPVQENEKIKSLKYLENESKAKNQTQLFMETPYRNIKFLAFILKTLNPSTFLCVASNLSCEDEYVRTMTVQDWRKTELPDIHKKPTVFLLQS